MGFFHSFSPPQNTLQHMKGLITMSEQQGHFDGNRQGIPAYVRVKKALMHDISTNLRAEHSKLPSEEELSRAFGMARGTIRHALSELAAEGYIYRVHGKGTFVRARDYEHVIETPRFVSFLDDLIEKGITPIVKVLEVAQGYPDETTASRLGVGINEKSVYTIRRLRTVDDKVIMYSINNLPCPLYPNMLADGNDYTSLYGMLFKKCGVQVNTGTRLMQAVSATEDIAAIFRVPEGYPLMYVQQIVYDGDNRCVDCAYIWLRSDSFRFTINMRRHMHEADSAKPQEVRGN